MNGFLFCVIANVTACATIAWLGWLYFNTSDRPGWLIFIMALLTVHFVIPSTDIFKCPKCGHTDKVKTYTGAFNTKTLREDKGEEMDLPQPSNPKE